MWEKTIAEKLAPRRTLEKQSDLARLMFFLYLNNSGNMTRMIDNSNIYPNAAYAAVKNATEGSVITFRFEQNMMHCARRMELSDKGCFRCRPSQGNQRFPFKMMSELSIEVPLMKTRISSLCRTESQDMDSQNDQILRKLQ